MDLREWLAAALADAERRGLPELEPMLETLARATAVLRAADWMVDATGGAHVGVAPRGRPHEPPPWPSS